VPVIITCACGKKLRAGDHQVGKTCKCPACGGMIKVPYAQVPANEAVPSGRIIRAPGTSSAHEPSTRATPTVTEPHQVEAPRLGSPDIAWDIQVSPTQVQRFTDPKHVRQALLAGAVTGDMPVCKILTKDAPGVLHLPSSWAPLRDSSLGQEFLIDTLFRPIRAYVDLVAVWAAVGSMLLCMVLFPIIVLIQDPFPKSIFRAIVAFMLGGASGLLGGGLLGALIGLLVGVVLYPSQPRVPWRR